jgi:hypothetical protein
MKKKRNRKGEDMKGMVEYAKAKMDPRVWAVFGPVRG